VSKPCWPQNGWTTYTVPVAVQVAKGAAVEADVEDELVARARLPQRRIVRSPVAIGQVDDLGPLRARPAIDGREHLAVGVGRHTVEQRGDQLALLVVGRREPYAAVGLGRLGG